jgi:hypothetical protein
MAIKNALYHCACKRTICETHHAQANKNQHNIGGSADLLPKVRGFC